MSEYLLISEEKPEICQFCHNFEELRPYGPNNEEICFECAMKDERTTNKKMMEYIYHK
jgi:hypothetical protein